MYNIIFYKDRNGREPTTEYLDDLRSKASTSKDDRIKSQKIDEYFDVLERMGTRAGLPYTKHIEGDLWELRPLKDRFFFAYWKDNKFIVLHHFHKTTQKTPPREIDQAKRNLDDFMERIEEDE